MTSRQRIPHVIGQTCVTAHKLSVPLAIHNLNASVLPLTPAHLTWKDEDAGVSSPPQKDPLSSGGPGLVSVGMVSIDSSLTVSPGSDLSQP